MFSLFFIFIFYFFGYWGGMAIATPPTTKDAATITIAHAHIFPPLPSGGSEHSRQRRIVAGRRGNLGWGGVWLVWLRLRYIGVGRRFEKERVDE